MHSSLFVFFSFKSFESIFRLLSTLEKSLLDRTLSHVEATHKLRHLALLSEPPSMIPYDPLTPNTDAYILTCSILAFGIIYAYGNLAAIDAFFFGCSANTESGLNT